MMASRSLAFIALLLCAILVQSAVTEKVKAGQDEDADLDDEMDKDDDDSADDLIESDDDDDEDADEDESDKESEDEEEEEEEESIYPSLSCVLFKNTGCNSECSVIGSAFGIESSGVCLENDICDCTVTEDTSLDELWKSKFTSKDILQQIKKNKKISKQVHAVLKDPFRTAQEIKEDLKPILSKDQFKTLKLADDDSDAAKMKQNGTLNLAAIKKHVAKKLPTTLKCSDKKVLSNLKYKPTLLKALKNAENETKKQDNDALNTLILEVRRTKNKSLMDIVSEYLNKNNLKDSFKENNDASVADTIVSYVIDELIKLTDEKKSPKKTTKKPTKKSTKSSTKKSSAKKQTSSADDDDDEDDTVVEKDRFKMANINKNNFRNSGQINQNWSKNGNTINYQKTYGGNISLNWVKGTDVVNMQKTAGGNISQNWVFGNVKVSISKTAGGNVSENWNFGTSSYQYSKSAGGNTVSNWSSGKAEKKTLKKYKKFIDAWCKENEFLIEKQHCVIYNTSK